MPQPDPFWICHQCGAQMRPLMIDGVPHCASCRSEFIEILDAEINPDPRHELPPPPPTRPGLAPSGPPPLPTWTRPGAQGQPSGSPPPARNGEDEQQAEGSGGGILGGIFNFFSGGGGSSSGPTGSSDMPQPPRGSGSSQQGASGGGRSWEWSFGNGAVRVQGFSGPVPRDASPFGNPFFPGPSPFVGGYAGAPGNPNQGLDAFFSGFGAPIHPGRTTGDGPRGPVDPLQGGDLLRALLQIVMEEGAQPIPLGPNGQLGDYVMTDRGYNDILERLMQATGPQGPLPASEETISSLERFTFDEKTLAASQYKDCPVCMDDFKVGDEAMKIPCGHEFHPDCLKPWLETNGSCPVCRYSLVSEEGQAASPGNAEAGPSDGTEPTNAPTQPDVPAGPLAGITSVLHRLFGQAGTTDTPTAPGDIHRPSSQPPPAVPERPGNPEDDPPEPLIDFDTPVRTTSSGGPRRPLPEWARQARGLQGPDERSTAEPPRPSPPLPATSGGTSTFGQGGLVPPTDLFDSDVAQFRATRGAGDVAIIPWTAANHQHVGLQYALLGEGNEGDGSASESRADDPLLFCHAAGAIGDFSLLQLRRVAGRAETERAPIREGRMCCHVVAPGVPGEAEMGRIIRECPGAGTKESSTLSFSGERPGSIASEDVD